MAPRNTRRASRSAKVNGQYADDFELGKPAPHTLYADLTTGKISRKAPETGNVLVFEGDVVRQHMLDAMSAGRMTRHGQHVDDVQGDADGDGDGDGDND